MDTWMPQFNVFAATWLDAIGRASWQAGLAFILVWAVCRVFKSLPARAKCWLWRLAYLKLLVAFLCATPINLALLPAKPSTPTLQTALPITTPLPSSPEPRTTTPPVATPSVAPEPSIAPSTPSTSPVKTVQAPSVHIWPTVAAWLLIIWALGIFCFGVRLWRKLISVRRVQSASSPVTDPALLQCSSDLARSFGLRAPILLASDAATSPMLVRMLRPAIVLPSALASGSSLEHLRLMLAHEMAHLKRFDLWWGWLAVLGEALFFFHPLLWFARREWRLAQEMACDELAVRMTRTPVSVYGDMLVGAAALNATNHIEPLLVTMGLTETKAMLAKRLKAMKLIKLNSTKRAILATTAILTLGILSVLPWRVTAQTASNTPPSDESPRPVRARGGIAQSATNTRPSDEAAIPPGARSGERPVASLHPPGYIAPTNVAAARFEATIYELTVPTGDPRSSLQGAMFNTRISALDGAKLEAASATPQSLAKSLETFGPAKILYKVDQIVNLYGEDISIGASEPLITSARTDHLGQTINGITYQGTGLFARITPLADGAKTTEPKVQVTFDLSTITGSGVESTPGVEVPRILKVRLSQSGTPTFGKPTVLVSVNADRATDKMPALAFIVRYVFTRPTP